MTIPSTTGVSKIARIVGVHILPSLSIESYSDRELVRGYPVQVTFLRLRHKGSESFQEVDLFFLNVRAIRSQTISSDYCGTTSETAEFGYSSSSVL